MKLIIYMPAFNEADNIQNVIKKLPHDLGKIDTIDVLVIDDGSTDETAFLANSIGAKVVVHHRNLGVGAAFHSAVQYSLDNDADILVGIDADGQFNPDEIRLLIRPILDDKADMVIGNRFSSGQPAQMPRVKYLGNIFLARMISSLCGQKFLDVSCGFRAYNREALIRLNIFAQFTYTHESILSLVFQGMRVVDCPIQVKYDPSRISRVAKSIRLYTMQTIKIILRVLLDYRPMQIFGTFGFTLIAIGMICEIFLMGYYVFFQRFTPYKNIGFIGLGFIIFGTLVLIIALVADMLNRIRMNQDRLLYELKKNRYGK